jgi:uncharacterized membrane protein
MKQRKTKTFLACTTIFSLFPFLAWANGEESCPFMNGWGWWMDHGVIGFWLWSFSLVLIILVLFLVLKDKGKS